MKSNIWVVLGVILLLFIVGAGVSISQYNKAIRMNEAVKAQWAQVENQLNRTDFRAEKYPRRCFRRRNLHAPCR